MPQVIGYVGENGAGKSAFCDAVSALAREDSFKVGKLGFSDPLRETFAALNDEYTSGFLPGGHVISKILENSWGIPGTNQNKEIFARHVLPHFERAGMKSILVERRNFQLLAQLMQKEETYKEGALSRAVFARVARCTEDLVNADGVRWVSDERELRKIQDPPGLLVYVTAPFDVRVARMRKRARDGEDQKTDEQFRIEEQALNEVHIPTIGKRADRGCAIVNDSDDPKYLQKKAALFYISVLRPRLLALR